METHRFPPGTPGDALLVVSELVRHKRVHVALEAARRARVPIRVVGSGPDHAALSAAYPEAEFLGRAGDEELAELYASARAVIVPSMEEFGITAVEAQAAGRPVIAAAAGGALETVLDGQTGRLVDARRRRLPSRRRSREIDKLDFDPARAPRKRRALLGGGLSASSLRTGESSGEPERRTAGARSSPRAPDHPRRAAASIVAQRAARGEPASRGSIRSDALREQMNASRRSRR